MCVSGGAELPQVVVYNLYLEEGTEKYLTFMELLLDDDYASGTISCPEEIYGETGDMNTRLSAKQNYEFWLRVLEKYPVLVVGISENDQLQSAGFGKGCGLFKENDCTGI